MTAQIPDIFIFEDENYDLVYLDGQGLIIPQDYEMNPRMLHTACYCGFYSTYKIEKRQLIFQSMVIGEVEDGYKPINGVMPIEDKYHHTYQNVNLLAPFTGTIRLGKDFIQELYIHMGYQKGSAYETLLEFQFDQGDLIEFKDLSEVNAQSCGSFKRLAKAIAPIDMIDISFNLGIDDLLEQE